MIGIAQRLPLKRLKFSIDPLNQVDSIKRSIRSRSFSQKNHVEAIQAFLQDENMEAHSFKAPDASFSNVQRGSYKPRKENVDEFGLPYVYDKELIEAYWRKHSAVLALRWSEFIGYSFPFFTKLITILLTGGWANLQANANNLARDARIICEKLGPTYVKLGQMLSVRPDVLSMEAIKELRALQDSVKPFPTDIAMKQIEHELQLNSVSDIFSEISPEPVASASLAQVYKGKLKTTGAYVAIKVQRPQIVELVSKDLYVLQKATHVYQRIVRKLFSDRDMDYIGLFNEWAIGFYTELDFLNEAHNQIAMKTKLSELQNDRMYIPEVYIQYCTRRLVVTEWIDGVKLSTCPSNVIARGVADAQDVFLTQLFTLGMFHADPHPGNILYMSQARGKAQLALIDFGLVTTMISPTTQKDMMLALIHLINYNYAAFVDDLIALEFLPPLPINKKDAKSVHSSTSVAADTKEAAAAVRYNRHQVMQLLDRIFTPYLRGGGFGQYYEQQLTMSGHTQKHAFIGMNQLIGDFFVMFQDLPLRVPTSFALLGRALVTLEGIALLGNPTYAIVHESYPFLLRKLLQESGDGIASPASRNTTEQHKETLQRVAIRQAIHQLVYAPMRLPEEQRRTPEQTRNKNDDEIFQLKKFIELIELVMQSTHPLTSIDQQQQEGDTNNSFSTKKRSMNLLEACTFLYSPDHTEARLLRELIENESIRSFELLFRQFLQRVYHEIMTSITIPSMVTRFLPNIMQMQLPSHWEQITVPVFLPNFSHTATAKDSRSRNRKTFFETQQLLLSKPLQLYWSTPEKVMNTFFPLFSPEEELQVIALQQSMSQLLGVDVTDTKNMFSKQMILQSLDVLHTILSMDTEEVDGNHKSREGMRRALRTMIDMVQTVGNSSGLQTASSMLNIFTASSTNPIRSTTSSNKEKGEQSEILQEIMVVLSQLSVEEKKLFLQSVEYIVYNVLQLYIERAQRLTA